MGPFKFFFINQLKSIALFTDPENGQVLSAKWFLYKHAASLFNILSFYMSKLLEVKLPYDPVCSSVVWLV